MQHQQAGRSSALVNAFAVAAACALMGRFRNATEKVFEQQQERRLLHPERRV
jgi:hypothetical protein